MSEEETKQRVGLLKTVEEYRDQLIARRAEEMTPQERSLMEADILGYDALLAEDDKNLAQAFFRVKQESPKKMLNNLSVIQYMKKNKIWK